ncbi:MAG TPA: glycoside hydrolase family 16 protein [Capsulimonadaceae bacterium]|jgi:beta-glucanase (GH16 family)
MQVQRNYLPIAIALLIAATCAVRAASPIPANLIANGTFTSRTASGEPVSWTSKAPQASVTTGNDSWATVVSIKGQSDAGASIEQSVHLQPEWTRLLVRGFFKVTAPSPTGASPSASVQLSWRSTGDAASAPPVPAALAAPFDGWTEVNQLLTVPKGATDLVVAPSVAAAATASFRDLSVVAWVPTLIDDFDGYEVNQNAWTPTDSDHFVYSPGIQHFSPDYVHIEGGSARFHADKVAYGTQAYQSGELTTLDKFQQLYGYWEFKVKLPMVRGVWPAAYLIRWDNGWPPEIDVQEMSGNDTSTVIETNHYADDYGRHKASSVNWDGTTVDRSQWHTYAVCWEPDALAWYFDDKYMGTTRPPDGRVSDVPMYIRLNLAVGSYGGDPEQSPWPQDLVCDFVHVYQRHDFPLPLYCAPSQEITIPVRTAYLHAIASSPMTGATVTWALVEGPGAAIIAYPGELDTMVTLTKPGMYRFSVKVEKGQSSATRETLVYLNPEAPK